MSNKASGKGKNVSGGSGPRGKPTPRKGAGVVAAARQPTSRRGTLAGVVVVMVLVLVIAGFLYQRTRTTPVNNGYGAAATAQVMVTNGVVRVGAANAPVTLNVFEDFTCPICGQFEGVYGQQLAQSLDQGKVAVNYHMLDFLNNRSASKDYSTRAAGAALCVAGDGTGSAFSKFHSALFAPATQPKENSGTDLSNTQLAKVAADAGASPAAQQCISSGAQVAAAATAAQAGQSALAASGNPVATPTILEGTTKIDINNRNWLTSLG